ncbi:hypothetical protein KUTeg_005120 [Tegillarca granosa]|uniref:MORN repeat-containing protein 4 n=1 Tax=Tegillarca granosa TaxID=220873 RepID=A0ABQ9FM02_TEGGR|nr:hypothetical protein KUTeg_005120 [Tegillarca granosa]
MLIGKYQVPLSHRMRGLYKYPDGSEYNGNWNDEGQRHGYGHMKFPDGTEYYGTFDNGLCSGSGIMLFSDTSSSSKQETPDKSQGLVTFSDGTHGLPRNEGYFDGNKMTRREKCPHVIRKAQDAAIRAKDSRRS